MAWRKRAHSQLLPIRVSISKRASSTGSVSTIAKNDSIMMREWRCGMLGRRSMWMGEWMSSREMRFVHRSKSHCNKQYCRDRYHSWGTR
jgi:hypothetical protein